MKAKCKVKVCGVKEEEEEDKEVRRPIIILYMQTYKNSRQN